MGKIMELYRTVARWVHAQHPVVSSISHLLICLGGITLLGWPLGALVLASDGVPEAVAVVFTIAAGATVYYGARERRNENEKGFMQAWRDGDTLFGADFLFALVGSVAGFILVRALLGI